MVLGVFLESPEDLGWASLPGSVGEGVWGWGCGGRWWGWVHGPEFRREGGVEGACWGSFM
jgi:hypothetical protein